MKDIIIVDLDGTLALIDHRRHWLDKEQHLELSTDERWRKFYLECENDVPNVALVQILQSLWIYYEIHIFSGRSNEVLTETIKWLKSNGIIYESLRMREKGDYTPDEQLKEKWLPEIDVDRILCVFDDRQKVVDMWRSKGLTCFQVAKGDF